MRRTLILLGALLIFGCESETCPEPKTYPIRIADTDNFQDEAVCMQETAIDTSLEIRDMRQTDGADCQTHCQQVEQCYGTLVHSVDWGCLELETDEEDPEIYYSGYGFIDDISCQCSDQPPTPASDLIGGEGDED